MIEAIGGTSALELTIVGRSALGIAAEEDLDVNATTELAVDTTDDLAVSSGVFWRGSIAIQILNAQGASVEVLGGLS